MENMDQQVRRSELRKFGLMFGVVFSLVFGLVIPLIRHGRSLGLPFSDGGHWQAWPWITGGLIVACALFHPASLAYLERAWMAFARVAQWVNTRIIMLLLFYVMILPIGLLLRLFGKDSLKRKFDSEAASYRVHQANQDKHHMEKPF
jgi:hypothetical protein